MISTSTTFLVETLLCVWCMREAELQNRGFVLSLLTRQLQAAQVNIRSGGSDGNKAGVTRGYQKDFEKIEIGRSRVSRLE